jgi:hypothetical protein
MASGWKIITTTKRLGGGQPMKEYFLVAIADRDEAGRRYGCVGSFLTFK